MSSILTIPCFYYSCPMGLQMTANRFGCEDRNECDWQPCGRGGQCYNLPRGGGFYCDCVLENFRCDNCSCDDGPLLRRGQAPGVAIGNDALLIIVLCIIFYISKLVWPRLSGLAVLPSTFIFSATRNAISMFHDLSLPFRLAELGRCLWLILFCFSRCSSCSRHCRLHTKPTAPSEVWPRSGRRCAREHYQLR